MNPGTQSCRTVLARIAYKQTISAIHPTSFFALTRAMHRVLFEKSTLWQLLCNIATTSVYGIPYRVRYAEQQYKRVPGTAKRIEAAQRHAIEYCKRYESWGWEE